jgi:hypothetical protein
MAAIRERSMATIVAIKDKTAHPNADRLVTAHVKGKFVIVLGKDYVNEGDIGVYFEVDSVLPNDAEWVKRCCPGMPPNKKGELLISLRNM